MRAADSPVTLLWIALILAAGAVGFALGRRRGVRLGSPHSTAGAPVSESDERVMQAVETLPLGLVLYDRSGNAVFRNSSALELGGNRHQRPLVDAALEEVSSWAALKGNAERSLDLFGPPRQVLEFRGSQVVVDTNSIGVVVIIEDVTEQRRTIEVRRDFVANVSHELKTPVGAMGILAEALVDTEDPAVVDRLAGRLHAEAIRLGNTIDDLLALSEIESGSLSDEQLVDPSAVMAAAVARCTAAAELRSIRVSIRDDSDGARVLGDRRQLLAAVGNLADNAVKYSDPNSEVSLSVARRTADSGEEQVVIEVTDAGIGIPASDRERIFERFYRVDQARSRSTGGTGLGLSIVRHVAINHRGTVELESVEGEGSTFRLLLPLATEPVAASTSEGS